MVDELQVKYFCVSVADSVLLIFILCNCDQTEKHKYSLKLGVCVMFMKLRKK